MKVRKGFTLIELLIVLAIIGVLMSIGVPVYTTQLDRAKARVVAANLKTIAQTVANLAVLGHYDDYLPSDGSSKTLSSNDIKGIVKGFDTTSYAGTITLDDGSFSVVVYYNDDTSISSNDIAKAIADTCDSSHAEDNGKDYAACVLNEIPKISY